MTLLAYHNDPAIKSSIISQLEAHRDADEIIKGPYWQDGKGCAVGCTIHSGNHAEYVPRFGIPEMLARLEDTIFEGLPNGQAKAWPLRFMNTIKPGADLSRVGWQFLHWLLTDESINPGINHPLVRDAVKQCTEVLLPLTKGEPIAESAAWSAASAAGAAGSARIAAWSAARSAASAARSAARSAESAARSAESAASAAWSAARSAESAESAESAAWSAESARSAASAARSAESAARSAESAESAAWSAESTIYIKMSDKLIKLIEAAP